MCFLDDKIVIFFTVESTWIACLTAVFFLLVFTCDVACGLIQSKTWSPANLCYLRTQIWPRFLLHDLFICMCITVSFFILNCLAVELALYHCSCWSSFFWVWPAALGAALVGCFILLPGESFVHVFGDLGFALRYFFMRKNYVFWSSFVVIMHLLM